MRCPFVINRLGDVWLAGVLQWKIKETIGMAVINMRGVAKGSKSSVIGK